MYKIKIINYKPYEYQLFQKTLDRLGKQGYESDDLSFITIFKKVDHPIYYKIDFFKPKGKTKNEKNISKSHFYDPYLEEDYQVVYSKKNMYVFKGDHKCSLTPQWEEKEDVIDDKRKQRDYQWLIGSIIATLVILYTSYAHLTLTTFQSYGMAITYLGIIFALLTLIYRSLITVKRQNKFLHDGNYQFPIKSLQKERKMMSIASIITIVLIIGGLVEDTFNARSITPQDHDILMLEELGIDDNNQFQGQQQSTFMIPHIYTTLETSEHNDILYIKEYQFHSTDHAQNVFQKYEQDPQQYYWTHTKKEDNVLYGYNEEKLASLVIINQQRVIYIDIGFAIHETQIKTIIQHYSS